MSRPFALGVQELARAKEILAVLVRHGFGDWLGRLPRQLIQAAPAGGGEAQEQVTGPERALRVIEDLGATFVKLGQILSTRPDILPPEYIEAFSELQDNVPSFSAEEARSIVAEELRQPIDLLFEQFDSEPVASASIAQVHRAVLPDGTPVAVKIQRPDIEERIRSDIHILYTLAEAAEGGLGHLGPYAPTAVLQQFERAVTMELDFLAEARNAETLRANLADLDGVRVPLIRRRLCSHRVLTMEWVDGVKLSRLGESGVDPTLVMERVVEASYQQIFVDGFFHADPHPGNLLVAEDGTLSYVDFGLVGTLTRSQQDLLIDLFVAIIMRDGEAVARACYRAGGTEQRLDLRAFSREVDDLFARYANLSMAEQQMGTILTDLVRLTARHRLRLPQEYAMLARAGVTLDGVARLHVPEWNMFETLKPLALKLAARRTDMERISGDALSVATQALMAARDLPLQVEQIMMDLEHGRLRVTTTSEDLRALDASIRRMGTGLLLAIGAASLLVSAAVLTAGTEANLYGFPFMKFISAVAILVSLGSASGLLGALGFHMFVTGRFRPRVLRPFASWLVGRGKPPE